MTNTIVTKAVTTSASTGEIHHVTLRSLDSLDEVALELESLADDYVEIKSERRAEYWGTNPDGAEWRVHLHW